MRIAGVVMILLGILVFNNIMPLPEWAGWVLLVPRVALAAAVCYGLTHVPYGVGDGYTAVNWDIEQPVIPKTADQTDRVSLLPGEPTPS